MEEKIIEGCYIITNTKNDGEKYLVLVSGNSPFLKISAIWDLTKNRLTNDDVLRGKIYSWDLQNLK